MEIYYLLLSHSPDYHQISTHSMLLLYEWLQRSSDGYKMTGLTPRIKSDSNSKCCLRFKLCFLSLHILYTRWGWCPRTGIGIGQRLMFKKAVLVSIFGWQYAKVKSTKINPPLQVTRLFNSAPFFFPRLWQKNAFFKT